MEHMPMWPFSRRSAQVNFMHTRTCKFTCIFRTIRKKIAPTFNEIIKQKHRSAEKSLIQLYLADQAVKKQASITSKAKYALMLSLSVSVSLSLSLTHTRRFTSTKCRVLSSVFQYQKDIYKIGHKLRNLNKFLQSRNSRG